MYIKLHIIENNLIYEQDHDVKWKLPIDKIKLIGEYTTSNGPLADDYFFVFAVQGNEWLEAPDTAVDHHALWGELGQKLGAKVLPGLANSANWTTRVMYPASLEGKDLFEIIKGNHYEQSLWGRIIGITSDERSLIFTDNV